MLKKFVFFLLTIFVLMVTFVVCYASDESFVTKAIGSVKNKIDIPGNYTEFNSKITVEPDGQYAYFTWYGNDDEFNPGGQINVTVDNKLRIISFSRYFYGNFNRNYKISAYSSYDAEMEASKFLSKACPEFYPYAKLVEQGYSVHRNFEPYKFKFVRYEDGLPCYDNYIDVVVDSDNCKVTSFDVKWNDYDKVYPSDTKLSRDEALKSMYTNIGMIKEYVKNSDGKIYVRYSDLSDGVNYINAYTGNIVNTNYVSDGSYKNALTAQKNFDFWYADTEFDIESAISVVENNEYIHLDFSYVLTGIQYLQDNYGNYLYMCYDDFKGDTKTFIVDVVSGDIRHYDYYQQEVGSVNYNYSVEQCEEIAEAFVLNYSKSFINNCKLLNYNNKKNYNGEDICYFNYARFINDTAYDSNGIVVGISRSTGEVVCVRSGWDNINVSEYSVSLTEEQAFEKYINASGFELQYVTSKSMTQQMELRAVYAPNPLYSIYVDAVTGEVIDNNGEKIATEKIMYSDISGDVSKKQIETLYACGIFEEAEQFKPKENVLLCDFLLWMCRAIDCVDYESINDVSNKLVDMKIVNYDDLSLNNPITTEKCIKYIVSYLGYGEIAELSDTFKTDFVDEGMISQDMIGYAAIAKGLKIFQGNAFMPKEYVKRNVAAQILYNLISN